jgi:uncharacterized protein (UPF0332 family)
MTLHADLLAQAQHLVRREPRRPKQASLRRGISAAYYALFHLLVSEGARVLASGTQVQGMRRLLSRAFQHSEMSDVCRAFANANLPAKITGPIGPVVISGQLQAVATAFVDLQQARHEADYDIGATITRSGAQAHIAQVSQAFAAWQAVRNTPEARLFLVALFGWKKFRA